jgi:predicted NAD-dependent protein-ADP-ribosyltransferase YbiA (DUF1768 family)
VTDRIDRFDGKYRFLSNFDLRPHPSNEHLYQAWKATTLSDAIYVMAAPDPGEAKKRGQEIRLRPDWEEVKLPRMRELIAIKFSDLELRSLLLETGDVPLIEGNHWHDNYWGDCRCGRSSCRPEGRNMLGTLLMLERGRIRG